MVAEHGYKPVLDGNRGIECESMMASRMILAVFRKYRDLVKYGDKWRAVAKKASVEQRRKLEALLSRIEISSGCFQAGSVQAGQCTALVPLAAATQPGVENEEDELSALEREFGSLSKLSDMRISRRICELVVQIVHVVSPAEEKVVVTRSDCSTHSPERTITSTP